MIRKAACRGFHAQHEAPNYWKIWAHNRRSPTCSETPGMNQIADRMTEDLLRPILTTGKSFYLLVALLGSIVSLGLATWGHQAYTGIGITGDNWPVFWGFHETNFVFWIGISHAGTLISAILRMVNATWRRPVTRCAEAITAFALMIGAMFPLIHHASHGRPNYRSPLVWDFFAI